MSRADARGSKPAAPPARTARALAREQIRTQILAHARAQLATEGPAALSLRAIARELGMTSSGIYRYFASRDALLTELIIEVYAEAGERLAAAVERAGADAADPAARFALLARTLRSWAVAQPSDWALVYGSPVPGYVAPEDTVAPASSVTDQFIAVLAQMSALGKNDRDDGSGEGEAADVLAGIAELVRQQVPAATDVPVARVSRGVSAWLLVMGAISMELFGHLHQAVQDYERFFETVIANAISLLQ